MNEKEAKTIFGAMFFIWISAMSLGLVSVFSSCSQKRFVAEAGTIENVDVVEETPCPDRSLFTSDFEYNMSLTEDIKERCKIKTNASGVKITLRRTTKAEKQENENQ